MNVFSNVDAVVTDQLIEQLGWVLIHSLWQFAVVAFLGAIVVRAMGRCSAEARSGALIGFLVVIVACPVVTWLVHPAPSVSLVTDEASEVVREDVAAAVSSDVVGGDGSVVAVDEAGDAEGGASVSVRTFGTENGSHSTDTSEPLAATTGAVLNSSIENTLQLSWTERASATLRPWLTWAVGFWGVGVVLCSLRPVIGWLTLRRLKRVGVSPAPSELSAALQRVSRRIGVSRSVQVLKSSLAQVPLVVGYLRPVILLPASLATSLPTEQLEAILAHELAHIRRHDFIVNLLQVVVETLFFYHPAVWWLSHRIRIEREHCCDDLVVRTMNNRAEYGRALIAVEELRGRHTSLALGANDGSLIARIRRIAGQPKQRNGLSAASGLSVLVVLLGIAVLFGVTANRGLASADGSVPISEDDNVEEAPLPEGSTLRFGTSRFRMGRAIETMAVSADGASSVAGSQAGAAGFDLVTGRRAYSLPGLLGVAMSPDGKSFVAKGERTVGIHDAATGKRIRQIALPGDQFVWTDMAEFTPNGQAFAVASKENMKEGVPAAVHLINFKLGKTMRVFPLDNPETDLSATFSKVLGVAFSRDGQFMATGGYDNDRGTYFARLWDVKSGDEIRRFAHGDRSHGIRSLAFSPDGTRLATRSQDGRMRLFDVATGDSIKTFEKDGGGRKPRTVAFSPDGKTLVAAGNSLRLYDTATNEERLRIDRVQVSNLHFTEGGKYLVGAGGGTIFRWDTATGEPQTPVAGDSAVSQVFVTPDDRRVITHGSLGDAHVWDAATGEHLHRFGGRWRRNIAMSQDGRFFAWAVRDETVRVQRQPFAIYGTRIRLYDVVNNKLIDRFPGSTSDASEIAFNAEGTQLVTVGRRDGVVHVWNFKTGKEERSFPAIPDTEKDEPNQVARAVLSPDGKTLAVRYVPYDNSTILEDGSRADRLGRSLPKPRPVRLWDMATGKLLREIKAADGSPLLANSDPLVFAPDGHLLLVGSIAVDPARGKVVRRLPSARAIRAATFTPDARVLVTANSGDLIQYWDVGTWKKTKDFQAHGGITSLCIGPSGRLFSGHNDTTTLAWKSTRVPVASHEEMQSVRSRELTGVYLGKVVDYGVLLQFIGRQSKVPGQRGILEGRLHVDIPNAAIGAGVEFSDNAQTGGIDLHVGLWDGKNAGSLWDVQLGKVERGVSGTLYLTTYRSPSEPHYRFLRRIPLRKISNNARVQREDFDVFSSVMRGEGVPPAMNQKELTEKASNILDRVVWGPAIEGLQTGLLLDSPEPENRNVPLNSVVRYRVLVCNRNKKEMSFIARCLPVDFRNSPYLVPDKDIKSALNAANLPREFRATGGRQAHYTIAHHIKLKPGAAAVIVGHTGGAQHTLYVGNRGRAKDVKEIPRVGKVELGTNWIVQPIQIWLPSSQGYGNGTLFEGIPVQTIIDRHGKAEARPPDPKSIPNTEDAITLFPRARIQVEPKIAWEPPAKSDSEQRQADLRRCLDGIIRDLAMQKSVGAFKELEDFDSASIKISVQSDHPERIGFLFKHKFDGWDRNTKAALVRPGGVYFAVNFADPNNPSALAQVNKNLPKFGVTARALCTGPKGANPAFAKTFHQIVQKHLNALPHYRLFEQVDAELRGELKRLAVKYPQLRQTSSGPLTASLKYKSEEPAIRIAVNRLPRGKRKSTTPDPVPPESQYRFEFILMPSGGPVEQRVPSQRFERIGLEGSFRSSAGDPDLKRELAALITKGLAPFQKLEAAAAQQPRR